MRKFVKNMKCNLMLSAFLCVASATAMDSSKEVENYMRNAYRSAERLESYKKMGGDYKNHHDWVEESKKFHNNAVAALELNHPYAASLLSRTLYDTPDTMEQSITCLKQSIAFKKSKGISVGLSQDVSLLMDAEGISTKTVEGIQRLEEIDINRAISCYEYLSCNLEESQSDLAFGALMRLKEYPGSYFSIGQSYFKRGFHGEGLKWIEKYVQGLKKAHTVPLNHSEKAVLGYLESIVSELNPSPALQLQAAYLAHQYAINVNIPTSEAFSIHLNYYKLLKQMEIQSKIQLQVVNLVNNCVVDMGMSTIEALPTYLLLKQTNDQSHQIAAEIFQVGRLLAKIGEDNIEKHPKLLFQFAETQKVDVLGSDDQYFVVDMYRRAAHHGCLDGIEILANSPHFYKIIDNTIGIPEAVSLLVRHGQTQGLLNLYEQMKNPVFLVVLSLMLEGKETEISQNVNSLLAQYQDSYAPAMDLKIHQLLNAKNLSEEDICAIQMGVYAPQPQYGRKRWTLPTNGYVTAGYEFDTKSEAVAYKESLIALNKKLEDEKQQKIQEISTQKMEIIDALPAKEQFDLAQESKMVKEAIGTIFGGQSIVLLKKASQNTGLSSQQRGAVNKRLNESLNSMFSKDGKFKLFQEGYSLALEKSAENGFLPAVEELQDLYSPQGALASPEKAVFYGQIKDILTNEELGLLERVAQFQEAFKK